MQFTKLRLSGFKSFSDPVELAIEAGLTGVVGPNGCGKSNIVEALRWVMGESSARGLRGAEMDEVIFNGTGSRAGFDVAEVRLKLTGRAEGLPFLGDVDELEVARRIARGQGSVYRLNGREVRARDVQLLLADAGSGARSPAIVGQGQIGFIVDARPEERRRLLEDAAGIGGLHGRRREADAKLRETAANLQRVSDLTQAQAARLADLQRQDRQAERYRALSAELREVEQLALLAAFVRAGRRLEAARGAREAAARRDQEAQAGSDRLRRERRRHEDALPAIRSRLSAAREAAAALVERLAQRDAAAAQWRAHAQALGRGADEAQDEHERIAASLASLAAEIDGLAAAGTAASAGVEDAQAARPAMADAARRAARAAAEADAVREAAAAAAQARRDAVHAAGLVEATALRLETLRNESHALPAPEPADVEGPAPFEAALVERVAALDRAEAAQAIAEAVAVAARGALGLRQAAFEAERATATGLDAAVAALEAAVRLRRARAEDLARQRRRLAEREAALGERAMRHDAAIAGLDRAAALAASAAADAALASADADLDRAREAAAGAEAAQRAASARCRASDRARDTVLAEIGVLANLAVDLPERAVLHDLVVPADLERALAAALGDDLLVSSDAGDAAHWADLGTGQPAEPLPAGARPLELLLTAPALLRHRLARVGLVDGPVDAAMLGALRPGQRLVDRAGALWRWDGLVRAAEAETPSSARLRHRFRLDAARAELAAVEREADAAAAVQGEAETAWGRARASLAAAEAAWRDADNAQIRGRQALASVEDALARSSDEAAAVAAEREAFAGEVDELVQAEAALGDDPAQQLRGREEARRGAHALLRDAEAARAAAATAAEGAEGDRARAVEVLRHSRSAVEQAQAALSAARAAQEDHRRRRAEQAAAHRARIEALERELARLAVALHGERVAASEADARTAAASAALTEATAVAAVARDAAQAAAEGLASLDGRLTALRRDVQEQAARLEAAHRRHAELTTAHTEVAARAERLRVEMASLPEPAAGGPEDRAQLASLRDATAVDEGALAAATAALTDLDLQAAAAEQEALLAREEAALAGAALDHATADHRAALDAVRERLDAEPAQLLADADTASSAAAADPAALDATLARLRASRDRIGPVNLRAAIEAGELAAGLEVTRAEEAELRAAVARLEDAIARLDGEGRQRLNAVLTLVDGHFRALFQRLFGGGTARLRLVGSEDPLTAGLELEASPPGKRLASIQLLSGGEKTLTALALVFAFFLANPAPLCVLDEVDAPLDDANVERFVALMRDIAADSGTRFLVVTHHPLTMARTDRLYGVTMSERGVSRLVSVALEEAVAMRESA